MCLIILRRPVTNLQSGMVYKTISDIPGKVGNESDESVYQVYHIKSPPPEFRPYLWCLRANVLLAITWYPHKSLPTILIEGLENPHKAFLKVIYRSIQNGWFISWKIQEKWMITRGSPMDWKPPHGLETKSVFFVESESSVLKNLKSEFPWLNPLPSGNLTIWKLTNFSSLSIFTYKNMIIFQLPGYITPPHPVAAWTLAGDFVFEKSPKLQEEQTFYPCCVGY